MNILDKERYELEWRKFTSARAGHWDAVYCGNFNSWGRYYRQRVLDCYKNLVPENSTTLEIGCGRGDFLAALNPRIGIGVDFSMEAVKVARSNHPKLEIYHADAHDLCLPADRAVDYIILSDLINDVWDVQAVFQQIKLLSHQNTRVIINFHSHLWNIPLEISCRLKLTTPKLPQNWLTRADVSNLLEITNFQVLRTWEEVLIPIKVPVLSKYGNRYLVKIFPFNFFACTNFVLARPLPVGGYKQPSVSIIIPARNESGHIEEILSRIPSMGAEMEIVFVEGNSTDDTFGTIERVISNHPSLNCKLIKQPGRGKGDAVRAGFAVAKGEILMILDADITVPPEDLPRFYSLLVSGSAEFVNGVRLVYPMDKGAMQFLNLLANKAFSLAFTYLLGQPIRDTLCGTKVLWRTDYARIETNRKQFGDFDPFGDFDLLFGAAKLSLKILEVPVRYRARRYGETNISRWRHGWLLLRMVLFAARRIKFI